MREIRLSGSEGGEGQLNGPSLPLSFSPFVRAAAVVNRATDYDLEIPALPAGISRYRIIP
jgi:hypothetical protein